VINFTIIECVMGAALNFSHAVEFSVVLLQLPDFLVILAQQEFMLCAGMVGSPQ
jgi:hypothetical protein